MSEFPLTVEQRLDFSLATVMARRGVGAQAIGSALGVTPPDGARLTTNGELALLGVGPDTWLALTHEARPDAAERLSVALKGLASVSDQSSGYVVLRLSGPGARIALQRGAAIDLHDDAFGPGSVAVTMIAHIGVIVWRPDAAPAYDVALFRSFAGSFRHWLDGVSVTL